MALLPQGSGEEEAMEDWLIAVIASSSVVFIGGVAATIWGAKTKCGKRPCRQPKPGDPTFAATQEIAVTELASNLPDIVSDEHIEKTKLEAEEREKRK